MQIRSSVLELVGGTPLVRLNRITEGVRATVAAKVEYLNPGGSVKDRVAVALVDAAEASGALRPGGTIVEPTSGNTGVGLALVAQQRGYRCVLVVPDKVGEDKRAVLRAYGAEVVVTPTAVAADDPRSYYGVSDRLAREIPGAVKPDQFSNPAGPASHFATTGPEIWEATDGRITHLVVGIGTGGTVTGTARYLKQVSGGAVRVVGADPEGSVYSGGTGRPYLVEGVGEDIWPPAYDPSLVDEVIAVSDGDAFRMTRRLAREEGLLVGGSSGMATVAALRTARCLDPGDLVVVLLPDGGRGYLQKAFDDDWMLRHGFLDSDAGRRVRDLVRPSDADLLATLRDEPARSALEMSRRHGGGPVLVLRAHQPVVLGEIAGVVDERMLAAAVDADAAALERPVGDLAAPVPPLVGAGQPVAAAFAALEAADAVLVLDDRRPVALLTRATLAARLDERTRS